MLWFDFHDLRRNRRQEPTPRGVPESIAVEISGDNARDVFERYNIRCRRDAIEAMEKLARFDIEEGRRLERPGSDLN